MGSSICDASLSHCNRLGRQQSPAMAAMAAQEIPSNIPLRCVAKANSSSSVDHHLPRVPLPLSITCVL